MQIICVRELIDMGSQIFNHLPNHIKGVFNEKGFLEKNT
jgi:hypothetical protein